MKTTPDGFEFNLAPFCGHCKLFEAAVVSKDGTHSITCPRLTFCQLIYERSNNGKLEED